MKMVIMGAGHLAYHLSEMLLIKKFNIAQLYNRSKENAEIICHSRNIPFTCDPSSIQDADIYITATVDHAIEKVSSLIRLKDALIVHSSGSSSMSFLQGNYRKGVFYPLHRVSGVRGLLPIMKSLFLSS